MSKLKKILVAAGAAVVGSAPAFATDPTITDIDSMVAAAAAQVTALPSKIGPMYTAVFVIALLFGVGSIIIRSLRSGGKKVA